MIARLALPLLGLLLFPGACSSPDAGSEPDPKSPPESVVADVPPVDDAMLDTEEPDVETPETIEPDAEDTDRTAPDSNPPPDTDAPPACIVPTWAPVAVETDGGTIDALSMDERQGSVLVAEARGGTVRAHLLGAASTVLEEGPGVVTAVQAVDGPGGFAVFWTRVTDGDEPEASTRYAALSAEGALTFGPTEVLPGFTLRSGGVHSTIGWRIFGDEAGQTSLLQVGAEAELGEISFVFPTEWTEVLRLHNAGAIMHYAYVEADARVGRYRQQLKDTPGCECLPSDIVTTLGPSSEVADTAFAQGWGVWAIRDADGGRLVTFDTSTLVLEPVETALAGKPGPAARLAAFGTRVALFDVTAKGELTAAEVQITPPSVADPVVVDAAPANPSKVHLIGHPDGWIWATESPTGLHFGFSCPLK